MNNLELSIIVPIYNVEAFLDECLRSIFDTTVDHALFEVIIVNDGTLDNSMAIVQRYAVRYSNLRVIEQKNQGLSSARMNGLAEASGNYIWFVDSDDWLARNALSEVVKAVQEEVNSDLFVIPVKWEYSDKDLSYTDTNIQEDKEVTIGKELLRSGRCPRWIVARFVIKKQLFQNSWLYFPQGLLHEDLYFSSIVLYLAKSVIFIKGTHYCYRIRPGSIMSTRTIRSSYDTLAIYGHIECFWRKVVQKEDKEWFHPILCNVLLESYKVSRNLVKSQDFQEFRTRSHHYVIREYRKHWHGRSLPRKCMDLVMLRFPCLYFHLPQKLQGQHKDYLDK